MIVSPLTALVKLSDKVSEIVQALSNRLTAKDNFGPEGELGQFLGSNGPNSPPSYKDITDLISGGGLQGEKGETGATGPMGPAGPPGSGGGGEFVPTFLAGGDVFTVPADKQVLFSHEIDVEGELVIEGTLIAVS